MSGQQQALVMEAIISIRKALKRKSYDSDSDSSIEHSTNRGHKLKKRARFVQEGNLAPSTGPASYKEVADHAGYRRAIIRHNPPLIDEEGYEIDSDDNEERIQEAILAAAEENPYSSIHLEHLLAPLTSVTDLPTHPTLSRPFTSKALTELATQAAFLTHKENAALWKVKPLLTKLQGDFTWAPLGIMTEANDHELFTDSARFVNQSARRSTVASVATPNGTERSRGSIALEATAPQEVGATGRGEDSAAGTPTAEPNGARPKGPDPSTEKSAEAVNGDESQKTADQPEGQETSTGDAPETASGSHTNGVTSGAAGDVEMTEDPSSAPNQDGRRSSANAESHDGVGKATGVGTEDSSELPIHPLFLAPRSAHPDRNQGLSDPDADEIRRLILTYVQKQEAVCRGMKMLHEGLLKADRYRGTVLKWAKAEAHCGPNRDLSDGEDWYDKEEWGLTEDLKKGQDEEEEDTTQTQKKTRNRR